jgi:magnesium chelatase family protein
MNLMDNAARCPQVSPTGLQPNSQAPQTDLEIIYEKGEGNIRRSCETLDVEKEHLNVEVSHFEFDRRVLESLREPLETGTITVSRARRRAEFPARFQLVAAMNPCPCGHHGDPLRNCRCTPDQIARYRGRLSGPLLDRIDLVVEVPAIAPEMLARGPAGETSARVLERVQGARAAQVARQGCVNADLRAGDVERHCRPDPGGETLLQQAMQRLKLSARAYHRVLRVARTLADLAGVERPGAAHIAEAIQYRRSLDSR